MKKRKHNNENSAGETPAENSAAAFAAAQEQIKLLKEQLAQARAAAAAAKPRRPAKNRLRAGDRRCLWLDSELHDAFKEWAAANAAQDTEELAGNKIVAAAISWAIPPDFEIAPKTKTAETPPPKAE